MWLLYVMKRKSHMRWWNFPEHKKSKVERYRKKLPGNEEITGRSLQNIL